MKNVLFFSCLVFASLHISAAEGTLVIDGKYQNKNIYVQNAFNQDGVGFCAYEVRVNGRVTTDEVGSSAFEIDLTQYNLKQGDAVQIEIFHKEGCQPRILNPEALKPRPTFDTKSITISATGLLTWTVTGETGSLPFVIEQFRWQKWITVGEIDGIGTPGDHTYSFQVVPHSGANRFRVKQVGFNKEVKYTAEVTYTPANMPAITFTQSKDSKTITLSAGSLYEMYDAYGNVVLKGFGTNLDLADFKKGTYFLCYDDKIDQVVRK